MTELHEVLKPIICSPYQEPDQHYLVKPGEPAKLLPGRRAAVYYYRPPERQAGRTPSDEAGTAIPLHLVNDLRERVKQWRNAKPLPYPGATGTTYELLQYWRRPEREGNHRLFFCQLEAAETIIFLTEARADMLQSLDIPRDEPGEEGKKKRYTSFTRYACKMATGTGKTTVMGMLAAWSILNKVNDRSDGRFSDVALILCPSVTIRDRLQELDPNRGEQSLYRTRDLVPPHLMESLRQGKVVITNWHVLEPQQMDTVGGTSSRVVKRGIPQEVKVTRTVDGKKVEVVETHYFESDSALVERVLGKRVGGKQNILVFNDEAHHAYRLKPPSEEDARQSELWGGEEEEKEHLAKEATVWVNGLDKINKLRGINFCVDLSATPYYLNNTGNEPNRPFPWVVSDFSLVDAIESALVKIPQLPVKDTTGAVIPAYFNVWKWIIETKLTPAEKGGRRGQVSPKAVLKYAQTPIAQLAGLWRETLDEWAKDTTIHATPPVFIIVCRDTKLAKVVYEWVALGESDMAAPIPEFLNKDGSENTVRVDSKVVEELESGQTKSLESRRLRFILETIGKKRWTNDRPPQDWLEIAEQLNTDPLIPPGRDVRCIISVSMLTEGWDATTVTHIVGLRPFQSQLLCEQVVGRGLRRSRYDVLQCEKVEDIPEEEAKIYGVPFEIIPFKVNPTDGPKPPPKIHHVYAIPEKAALAIVFPRVERYTFAVKSSLAVDWSSIPLLPLDPTNIPPDVTMKGLSWSESGRPTLHGPGKIDRVTLEAWRRGHRLQELEFDLARTLTKAFAGSPKCEVPARSLFPQVLRIVHQFLETRVNAKGDTDKRDIFLDPYFGWAVQTLMDALQPDTKAGEAPELPVYEAGKRESGSTTDVDFWTAREVRDVANSHLNVVVADTKVWEQSAAYYLDTHENVYSFAKNSGLGFAIPYMHNGELHEYTPDFLVRLKENGMELGTLILETKGFDPLAEVKAAAARRWVNAVNNDGRYGQWHYAIIYDPSKTTAAVHEAARQLANLHGVTLR